MAFDESLAARVRALLAPQPGFAEKKMFGGLGFLLRGHMCCGVWKNSLIARVGPDAYDDALREPAAREFDVTGRPMRGWVMVGPRGVTADGDLAEWVDLAVRFVRTLPAK